MRKASRKVVSPRVVCVDDFRPLARRRLPTPVFDYLDGGAEGEVTLRENCRVFADVTFRPRQAVGVSACEVRTRVLGFDVAFPALLAPVGYTRLMHPDGEVGAARAAGAAGTAYMLSTISGHRVEDVTAASAGPVCFQLYVLGGRDAAEAVIERARVAGCAALVVTIDTPVAGLRERDYRNGITELLSGSLWDKLPFLPPVLARPAWLARFARVVFQGFCRKVRFWGKIQKSGIRNSMTYRPPNSRKSNFATEPFCTPGVDSICRQVQRQLLRNESARFYHHRTRMCLPPRKLRRDIQ